MRAPHPLTSRTLVQAFVIIALISIFCGLLLYALYLSWGVVLPFLVAFIFAYLLNPIVTRLARYIGRIGAIMAVYALVAGILILILGWALPTIWEQLKILWNYLPVAVDWYNHVGRIWINDNLSLEYELIALDPNIVRQHAISYLQANYQASDAQSFALKALSSGMSAVSNLGLVVLIPILTFYFLSNWQTRLDVWASAIPKPYYHKVLAIAKDCNTALMSFVKGQFLVMFLLGVIYAVQLQLIGLQLGLTIGMIAGIASFVPYVGFTVGIIAAIIAGLLQFGLDWVHLGLIIGAFMVGQIMEGYVLQPLLLGDKIGLSPIWVIFSVLAGASLLGFVGMLIALPVSALINVLFHHAYDAYKNSEWYQGCRQFRLF
ncbi:MAG: AI-2E family transporter [Moraxella sp.]|nr:AI-2E family transporter [Moraxella sp.]